MWPLGHFLIYKIIKTTPRRGLYAKLDSRAYYFLIVCNLVYGISAIKRAFFTALETILWCFWQSPVLAEDVILNWPETNLRRVSVCL